MTKRIVFGAALALVIVGLMAPSASATCPNSKSASTYNPGTLGYTYWHTTLTGPGTTLVAKIWQPGGADVTGTCNTRNNANGDRGIIYFGTTDAHNIGLNIDFATGCVGGGTACPVGQLAVLATVNQGNKTEFLTTQAAEGTGAVNFDFSTLTSPPHNMAAIPRPRILNFTKAGTVLNANVGFDAASVAAYDGSSGLITGYQILSKLSGSDPGRNANGYDTVGPTVNSSGGGAVASTPVSVDCAGGSPSLNRRWVVAQLVTANGPSPTVSQATVVACDGSLAEPPGGKYKIVKPKVAPNSKKAN